MPTPTTTPSAAVREAARRRTFAIISHPDAGKTTLTEKLLLYGGALRQAGQVQARGGRKAAVSDWMEMEKTRGISVTSTALRFEHQGTVLNLLDTPGHRDFSEDTLRVLAAADSVVVLLDAARGVQEQTRMLFDVARARRLPMFTFVNKFDRPGMEPLEMLDHIETELGITPSALTWPVGMGQDFAGIIDRPGDRFLRLDRTPRGAHEVPEIEMDPATAADEEGEAWATATDELELLEGAGAAFDADAFLAGELTPVLFGSAMWNFGVRQLLEAVVGRAPAPSPRLDLDGAPLPLDGPMSAQVFKVQANTDPRHRDRLAFLRICAGTFERGMKVTNLRSGRPLQLNFAHDVFGRERDQLDEAFPGDVIGISGAQDVRVGDTLSAQPGGTALPPIPTLVPARFVTARPVDTGKHKQFRRGLDQLDEEGVVHLLSRRGDPSPTPVLGAVGELQFEVFSHRMDAEFGSPVRLESLDLTVARRVNAAGADAVTESGLGSVLERGDGTLLAAFPTTFRLERFAREHGDVRLDNVLAGDVPMS